MPDRQRPGARGGRSFRAAGRLGRFLHVEEPAGTERPQVQGAAADANLLILLRRVVWEDGEGNVTEEATRQLSALLAWAAPADTATYNGQPAKLIARAAERRRAAVAAYCRAAQLTYQELAVTVAWRLVAGLSAGATPHETSLALHGTYGIPILPGSALKGLAARACEDPARRAVLFGTPRPPGEEQAVTAAARQGAVTFLDALPAGRPVPLVHDVMTPHAGPYYARGEPPAEYWEPVPVDFLAVGKGAEFLVYLLGRDEADVAEAAGLLSEALRDLGFGAKTAAGYGYADTRLLSPSGVPGGR